MCDHFTDSTMVVNLVDCNRVVSRVFFDNLERKRIDRLTNPNMANVTNNKTILTGGVMLPAMATNVWTSSYKKENEKINIRSHISEKKLR